MEDTHTDGQIQQQATMVASTLVAMLKIQSKTIWDAKYVLATISATWSGQFHGAAKHG